MGEKHKYPYTVILPMWARIEILKEGKETEGRGSMCVCAFKSPQARVNVGKVTRCLSHDP